MERIIEILETEIKKQFRIWHNTSSNKNIKYAFVVYRNNDPIAQFKEIKIAEIFIIGMSKYCAEERVKELEQSRNIT